MQLEEFKPNYDARRPFYERLQENISSIIKDQLKGQDTSYLNIDTRIKTLESSFEKVSRKNYKNPFDEIEDFCGIRIICYYPSDVEKIATVLRREFLVLSEEDTQARLEPNEFGYRSTHLIIAIPQDWLKAPQYRGLDGLKAEVQIRTILMHAWAEIQHKLAYKRAEQVPADFQRKLFRLSAKFEEADEQLEDIRDGLAAYRSKITPSTNSGLDGLRGVPLNLDSLAILLDTAYPNKDGSESSNAALLDELSEYSFSMDDLIDAIKAQASIMAQIEEDKRYSPRVARWAQVGALRSALDAANNEYYSSRREGLGNTVEWRDLVEFSRSLLMKQASKPRKK